MLTKKDKDDLIKILTNVDVKKVDIDHKNPNAIKWHRFGVYIGLRIACDIIKELPQTKKTSKTIS
jgi:hypothetical protein